jgi:hypothetical protein
MWTKNPNEYRVWQGKNKANMWHFDKIEKSDTILVLNYEKIKENP